MDGVWGRAWAQSSNMLAGKLGRQAEQILQDAVCRDKREVRGHLVI